MRLSCDTVAFDNNHHGAFVMLGSETADQIEKSDVLPWVSNSYITHGISPKAHVLLLNIDVT